MTSAPPEPPIRDAASIIAIRQSGAEPAVLMGRRHRDSAFMPDIYVFPGGAVDAEDDTIALAAPLDPLCAQRLNGRANAIATAAIRELWEETGLRLAKAAPWPAPPPAWSGFAAGGFRPDASALRFIFRAITPKGRPRRFDARFFLAPAEAIQSELGVFDDQAELSDLRWVPLSQTGSLGLAPVTSVALTQAVKTWRAGKAPAQVPFFDGRDEDSNINAFRASLAAEA